MVVENITGWNNKHIYLMQYHFTVEHGAIQCYVISDSPHGTLHFFYSVVMIKFVKSHTPGWPSTQPNQISHNLAAHNRAAHNPAAWWCAGSIVCNIPRLHCRLAQRRYYCPDVGPTLVQPSLLSGQIVMRVTRTGDAHNRASTPLSRRVVCSSVVCC